MFNSSLGGCLFACFDCCVVLLQLISCFEFLGMTLVFFFQNFSKKSKTLSELTCDMSILYKSMMTND